MLALPGANVAYAFAEAQPLVVGEVAARRWFRYLPTDASRVQLLENGLTRCVRMEDDDD
jgi:hypothetical protein